MTSQLAARLSEFVSLLPWVEVSAGLAIPVTFLENTTEGAVRKVMPVACGESCETGTRYLSLVPDSEKRSIVYFEDYGTVIREKDASRYDCESTLRMVCWLNLAKLGYEDCQLSSMAVSQVMGSLPLVIDDGLPYNHIMIKVTAQMPKSPGIFTRYTYDEAITQYLMWPYDYFALEVKLKYLFTRGCEFPLPVNPAICP
jgi:hypothetical protein